MDGCHRPYGFENVLRILGTIFKGPAGPGVASFFGGQFFNFVGLWLKGVFAICCLSQAIPKVSKGVCVWVCLGSSEMDLCIGTWLGWTMWLCMWF